MTPVTGSYHGLSAILPAYYERGIYLATVLAGCARVILCAHVGTMAG